MEEASHRPSMLSDALGSSADRDALLSDDPSGGFSVSSPRHSKSFTRVMGFTALLLLVAGALVAGAAATKGTLTLAWPRPRTAQRSSAVRSERVPSRSSAPGVVDRQEVKTFREVHPPQMAARPHEDMIVLNATQVIISNSTQVEFRTPTEAIIHGPVEVSLADPTAMPGHEQAADQREDAKKKEKEPKQERAPKKEKAPSVAQKKEKAAKQEKTLIKKDSAAKQQHQAKNDTATKKESETEKDHSTKKANATKNESATKTANATKKESATKKANATKKESVTKKDNVTKKANATKNATKKEPKAVELFCFALIVPWGYEKELVSWQHTKKAGIFGCDDYAVYSNQSLDLGNGLKNKLVHRSLQAPYGGQWNTLLNTPIFISLWKQVITDGQFWHSNWTAKVDADAVMIVPRLRGLLRSPEHEHPQWGSGMFSDNCGYTRSMHGPIEVFSRQALVVWKDQHWKCKDPPQEDVYMRTCMIKLGAKEMPDFNLLAEQSCFWDWWQCKSNHVVFHPFKSLQDYSACVDRSQHPTPEPQSGR